MNTKLWSAIIVFLCAATLFPLSAAAETLGYDFGHIVAAVDREMIAADGSLASAKEKELAEAVEIFRTGSYCSQRRAQISRWISFNGVSSFRRYSQIYYSILLYSAQSEECTKDEQKIFAVFLK